MNKLQDVFLTVVVPIYNVEDYLEDCVNSLVNQSVIRHKILLINDGSKDKSGELAKNYEEQYPELITYVSQENQGLGATRNNGLKLVETEYVTFLDSDDWIDSLFVEKIAKRIEECDGFPDIIFDLPNVYDNNQKNIYDWKDRELFEEIFFKDGHDDMRVVTADEDIRLMYLEPSTNRRIIRTQFMRDNNISFSVGLKWEDVIPHFLSLNAKARCIGIANTGFFYRVNTGHQITSGGGKDRLEMNVVFSQLLSIVYKENWSRNKKNAVIKMLVNYSIWSVHATNIDYKHQYVKGAHGLFRKVRFGDFVKFIKSSDNKKMEIIYIAVLRGPFYKLFEQTRILSKMENIVERINRKLS